MLQIEDLTVRIAGRELLSHTSVRIAAGHRVGLVGRNGTGKTTLLSVIAGDLQADQGALRLPRGLKLGRVAQEAPGGNRSVLDTVLAADTERAALLVEAEQAADPTRIAEIHNRLADIGANAAPARAASILAGLGFDTAAQSQPCDSFSGGWRMRVALAATLFLAPDLLLLDEPTNHLDLEATLWLQSHLRSYAGTSIIVSHDRDLLNIAVDHIVHLSGQALTLYRGNYDQFEKTRYNQLILQEKHRVKVDAQRRHIQSFVDRFRYKASKARQAQSRLKMLDRLQPIPAAADERSVSFTLPEPEQMPPPLISMHDVAAGYAPDQPVLSRINLRIDPDDRIALLGANGNGKSTFARLLADTLPWRSGEIVRARKLRVGYFAQHQVDVLNAGETAYQHLRQLMTGVRESAVRARLGQFGLTQERAETAVASLSGGEKARLLLALIAHDAPHLLVLDEPTNHLDIDARGALIQALNTYPGAVVLISHDSHLVSLVADRLLLIADGAVQRFAGDMADYQRLVLQPKSSAASPDKASTRGNARDRRQISAGKRQSAAALRQEVRRAERSLLKLNQDQSRVTEQLASPDSHDGSRDIGALHRRHADLARRIAASEQAWLRASERLEAALNET